MCDISEKAILFIENVGNADKPVKYPAMFQIADVCIISKTDLLPYLDFDIQRFKSYASQLNPNLNFFELSVKTGDGFDAWVEFLINNQPK